ncbi:OmpL47-type beta-barrel domain-containing protein, partial [Paenibacillus pini]|uniref:OmpL47-type beta-barrel domain-containing protein n=1 Tax=Paenibacillus pini TaxID=669461 RepID=UPI0011DC87BA
MRNFSRVFLCMLLILSITLNNISYADSTSQNTINSKSSIGIRSTSVWAEQSVVEFGKAIKVHYSFNDEPHPVTIDIYKGQTWIWKSTEWSTNMSNTYEYKASDEGMYKFVITPLDNASNYTGECSVEVYKNRVILIPGIMGTELFAGSNQVWLPNMTQIISDIEKMAMDKDGVTINQITAKLPLPNWYKTLNSSLSDKYHVVDFGYDWRLGATQNAKYLKAVVDEEIRKSPNSKLYIVAHSMGGVIATEYINQGNGSKVDKLITLGTPYLGAPQAAYIFETGEAAGVYYKDLAIHKGIKKIMPNILSAYELLPSVSYFKLNSTSYLTKQKYLGPSISRWDKYENTKLKDYNTTKEYLKKRDWFNDGLMDRAEGFQKNLNIIGNLNSVDSYYIIGDQIPTIGGLTVKDDSSNHPIADLINIQGDGTVPLISATVGNSLSSNKTYYIKEKHGDLPGNKNVQQQVKNILDGNPNQLASNIRRNTQKTSTLKVKIESPVDLNIYDGEGNHLGSTGSDKYEENIPFASYYTDGETKIALLNDGDYKVRLKGTGYGDMIYSIIWSDENDLEEKTVRFDEIPVTPNSIFTSSTNKSGQITLQVDENGDGTVDYTMPPSVELDSRGTQDETIPTISSFIEGVKGVNDWYGKGVYYNLTGKDSESGVYRTFYDLNDSGFKEYKGPIQLPNTGIYNFKSFVRDKNRNDSEILTETVKVDTTNPTPPTMDIVPLTWTNKYVTVTLLNGTDADSGFQKYQYKIGQGGEWKDYATPFVIDTEGLHNVFGRTVDNVFNLSDEVTGEAKVDKTIPTTPTGFITQLRNYDRIKISWLPSTDNVGVVGYDVYLDSKYVDTTTSTNYTFIGLAPGKTYKFKILAKDEAGNYSKDGIYFDKIPLSYLSTNGMSSFNIKED